MKRLTSILAISVIAVMSAGAARADIASTTYVDNKVSPVATKANTNAGEIAKLQTDKQDKSAMVDSTSENLAETNDTNYPTVAAVYTIAANALGTQVNNKLDKKFTGEANKSKAVITDANGAITTGTISSAMIADSAITSEKIKDGTIATADLSGGSVTTAKIADLNVTEGKIAANAVTTAKIKDANVTTAKVADGAITSAKIADGTIVDADIADNAAIAQSKIAGLATSIADAKSAGTAATSALNTYKTSNDAALKAVKTTADTTAAAVNNATTGLAATNKIATDNATKLATMATSDTVNALTTRVGTAESNITNLQNGKQNKLVSSGENPNISGSNGVTVTVGTDGKIAVSGNQSAINTAIAEAKKAGTDAASALNTYKTSNDAAVAKKADSATMTTELAKKQNALGYTAENTANKVTAISSTSTDTQYPSAKAVYSELAKKQNNITIDSALSATSTNPVQNKVVNTALEGKIPVPTATNDSGLLVLTYNSTTKTYAWENIGR